MKTAARHAASCCTLMCGIAGGLRGAAAVPARGRASRLAIDAAKEDEPIWNSDEPFIYSPDAPRNFWRPAIPDVGIMNSWASNAVAPMDNIEEGAENQDGPTSIHIAYWPPRTDFQPPFPEPYPNASVVWSTWNSTEKPVRLKNMHKDCSNEPSGWIDRKGYSCAHYSLDRWCTELGREGPGWKTSWGTIQNFTDSEGVSASRACCACGGGQTMIVVGEEETPLHKRRLLAPEDKLPAKINEKFELGHPLRNLPASVSGYPLEAAEDKIPAPLVAPADRIPKNFARMINEINKGNSQPSPTGLSVRYYSSFDWTVQPQGQFPTYQSKPDFTGIDKALDYQPFDYTHLLGWPGKTRAAPPVFWAKWSGTLNVLTAGKYRLQLVVGFETTSELKIDGMVVKTPGQCAAARSKSSCRANGCAWDPSADEPCGVEVLAPPAMLQAPRSAARFLQAPAPAPAAAAPTVIPAATVAPALPITHEPVEVELASGGHCVEATVLVTNQGRTVRLLYSGPDTARNLIAVPSEMLFCDPVVMACVDPALVSCSIAGLGFT